MNAYIRKMLCPRCCSEFPVHITEDELKNGSDPFVHIWCRGWVQYDSDQERLIKAEAKTNG